MTKKKLGIWMDHQSAHLMEFATDSTETTTIDSNVTHEGKGESRTNVKEQHQHADYYKTLGKSILNYDSVLLFGPTDAKNELYNILLADQHFSKVKIEVKQADKMTDNQQHAFVKDHFSQN